MTNTAGERNTGASHRTSKRKRAINQMLRSNTWMSLGAGSPLKRSVHTVIAQSLEPTVQFIPHNLLVVLSPCRLSDSYPIVSMAKGLER